MKYIKLFEEFIFTKENDIETEIDTIVDDSMVDDIFIDNKGVINVIGWKKY
jgi:hypothetical protein